MKIPVLPIVIRGSGIVLIGGRAYYWKDKLTIKKSRPSFEIDSDMFGKVDTRSGGGEMVDIEFTPVGMLSQGLLAGYYPYGPSNLVAACSVGQSIFGDPNNPTPLVIATLDGKNWQTYARAGLYKSPQLILGPRKTGLGSMTFRALNRVDIQPSNAASLVSSANQAFTDLSFDPTKIATDIYAAAIGTRGAPYNNVGAREGFILEPVYKIDDAPDDNVGIADSFLSSIAWKLMFAPNNLTEKQIDDLANWQGAGVILPGDSVARDGEDIAIDADTLTASIHNVGVVTTEHGAGVKVDRNGSINFEQKMTFNGGVPNPLITLLSNI